MHAIKKQGGEGMSDNLQFILDTWDRLPRRTQLQILFMVWRGVARRKLCERLFNPEGF